MNRFENQVILIAGGARGLDADLFDFHGRVNSIHLGMIDTEMVRERDAAVNLAHEQKQPVMRMGAADGVSSLVLFLFRAEPRYMTGAELAIDGGHTL